MTDESLSVCLSACLSVCVFYLADSSHAAVNSLVPLTGLHRPLLEEEVDFVVVRTVSVRDGEGAHELRL